MKKFLPLILLIPLISFTLHKFYVSTIRVEYRPDQKTLQVTMRIFTDDLQETLDRNFHKKFELGSADEPEEIDVLIKKYINSHFEVLINNEKISVNYLGKEYENDMVFLYVELPDIDTINSITIMDDMLMDVFEDQKNIINIFIGDIKKSFVFSTDKIQETLIL